LNKAPLPDALLGRRYAQTFPVEGGVPPYTLTFSGHLPDGMHAVATGTTVLIEGVPETMGDYPLKLSLTDALGQGQTGTYLLHVTPNSSNAPASITVNEGVKADDNLGSGGGVADMETVMTADSILVKLNGSTVGNIFSVLEAIKTADSITIKINGSTVGNVFSVPEGIKAADTITIQLNGSTIAGVVSIPEGIKTADAITILLNGLTAGGSGSKVPEAIKTADTITILLNGLTVGGSGPTIPETIKTADTITIKLNGAVIGGVAIVPEAIKTADSITITLNGVKVSGIADAEAVKTTDAISILINGLSPGGGKPVTASEGIKALDAITIILNGATVINSLPVFVRESIKTTDAITVTLNGQPTATPLSILPATIPDAVYGAVYSQTFTPTGGSGAAVTFGHSGALPAGLSFSGGTGSLTISGTPSATGSFPITITASDGTNNATLNTTVIVDQATQSINLATLPTPTYGGSPFSVSATSSSGLPVTIAYVSGPATGSGAGPYTAAGAGTVNFTATQNGNANYAAATPVNFSVTIAPAVPVLAFAAIPAHTYGDAPFTVSASSASSGAVTYSLLSGAATVSSGGLVTLTGAGSLTLAAQQAATTNYTSATTQTSLSIAKQASVTSVTTSSQAPTPVQNVTLTATVAPLVTGTPSGTVTFFDNGVQSGSPVNVAGGQAQLVTTLLSGPQTISATYSGDANFLPSSGTDAAPVVVAPLDFTLNPLGTVNLNVVPGQAASFSFNVTPLYAIYPGPVSFAITGLPTGATASITPNNLPATGGAQTVTVTIQTPAALVQNTAPRMPLSRAPIALALLLPALAWSGLRRRRRWISGMLLVIAGVCATSALSGCGTSGNGYFGHAQKTYPLTITATSGTMQHTINVSLVVQ
jgi:hypothetical protein